MDTVTDVAMESAMMEAGTTVSSGTEGSNRQREVCTPLDHGSSELGMCFEAQRPKSCIMLQTYLFYKLAVVYPLYETIAGFLGFGPTVRMSSYSCACPDEGKPKMY